MIIFTMTVDQMMKNMLSINKPIVSIINITYIKLLAFIIEMKLVTIIFLSLQTKMHFHGVQILIQKSSLRTNKNSASEYKNNQSVMNEYEILKMLDHPNVRKAAVI